MSCCKFEKKYIHSRHSICMNAVNSESIPSVYSFLVRLVTHQVTISYVPVFIYLFIYLLANLLYIKKLQEIFIMSGVQFREWRIGRVISIRRFEISSTITPELYDTSKIATKQKFLYDKPMFFILSFFICHIYKILQRKTLTLFLLQFTIRNLQLNNKQFENTKYKL